MSPPAAPFGAEWDLATAECVVAAGEWDRLFDALERAGCELGVDNRMRALGLLGRLGAAGADLNDPDLLRAHLVPILATGAEAEAEFAEVIARWQASASAGAGLGWRQQRAQRTSPDAVAVVLRADRRSQIWLFMSVAGTLVLLFAWAMGWFPVLSPNLSGPTALQREIPPPGDISVDWQSHLQDVLMRVAFALPVLFFGLLLAGWRGAAGDRLVRQAGAADWSELFTLAAERVRWFAAIDTRRLFEALKQKLLTITDRIDVPASVEATLRAGMSPMVAYQAVEERSNYIVLVDRRGAVDHIEFLLQSLVAALAAAKVRFARYEFHGRPAFCTPINADPGTAVALPFTVLAKRHAGERLLMITDGEGLFEPPGWRALRNRQRIFVRPGTPVAEINRLHDFGHVALLTLKPRSTWGQRERLLQDLGFLVVPANAEGINRIGQHIARGGEEFADEPSANISDDSLISGLSAQALRYASNIPPPPEEIENLVTDLRIWMARTVLDDPLQPGRGFLVLCGVAAFPTIGPGLTLQIARLLSRASGDSEASIDSRLLAPLARLPWLRDGRMPDWLRIALLNSLDETDLKKIRGLQLAVLAEAQPASGPIDHAGLERIAAAFEVAVGKSVRELDEAAARVAPSAPGDEVERIFLAVLRGERLDPVRDVIAPEAPETIRERLAAPERRRRAVWIAATIVTAGVGALAEPVFAGWIAAGWNALAAFASTRPLSSQNAGFDLVPWLGIASMLIATSCLSVWLTAALQLWGNDETRRRLLKALRFASIVAIVPAAVYVFSDPAVARMPLLFAMSAAIFLRFAPASRTPGAASAADMLPARLEGDDWIATSLGSVVVAVLALGPVFLFAAPTFDPSLGFSLQLAGVLVGAATWGFGSRYVRYHLLGPIEGRPTAQEHWLDFVAPLLALLFIASATPELLNLAQIFGSYLSMPGSDFGVISRPAPIYFLLTNFLGSCFTLLTLRLMPSFVSIFRFLTLFTFLVSLGPFYVIIFMLLSKKGIIPGTIFWWLFFLFLSICAINNILEMKRIFVRIVAISVYGTLWVACITQIPFATTPKLFLMPFFLGFITPAAAVWWPNLRFILMARSSANRSTWSNEKPFALRVRDTFQATIASAWWFVPTLWVVSLRYRFLGMDIDVAPLAVPLAFVAGWRCGAAATIPVLVGSLPFVAHAGLLRDPAIASPGGLWPVIVLPLMARLVGDEALRHSVLGRERAVPVDCALFVLCLATAVPKATLSPGLAVSVDPSWLGACVGFLIGASRMRWREPAIAFAAGLGLVGTLGLAVGLRDWEFQSWALSAASFFGGRVWRSFVVPKMAGFRGIGTFSALLLMLLFAAILVFVPNIFAVTPIETALLGAPNLASLPLLALMGGIIVRKKPNLALVCWTTMVIMWASGVGWDNLTLGPGGAEIFICITGFAMLGYQLERRGEPHYARALGLVAQVRPSAAAPAGRIRILGGSLAGMEVPVSARVVLGRDPTKAQIVFPSEDTAVSRQHCEIRFDSAVALFEVRDLGSRNGTFVANGPDPPRRLAPEVIERLAPGQNILVGSSRNRLLLELG
jgi:hypothetical protein